MINPGSKVVRRDAYAPTHIADGASVGEMLRYFAELLLESTPLGAGAVVLRSVPDFAIMVGNPAVQTVGCRHMDVDFALKKGATI